MLTRAEKKQGYTGTDNREHHGRDPLAGSAGLLSRTQHPKEPGDPDCQLTCPWARFLQQTTSALRSCDLKHCNLRNLMKFGKVLCSLGQLYAYPMTPGQRLLFKQVSTVPGFSLLLVGGCRAHEACYPKFL